MTKSSTHGGPAPETHLTRRYDVLRSEDFIVEGKSFTREEKKKQRFRRIEDISAQR